MVGRYSKRTGNKRYNTYVRNLRIRQGRMQMAEIFKWIHYEDYDDVNPAEEAQNRVQWWPFVVRVINRGAP
jgi:hypothetical protein